MNYQSLMNLYIIDAIKHALASNKNLPSCFKISEADLDLINNIKNDSDRYNLASGNIFNITINSKSLRNSISSIKKIDKNSEILEEAISLGASYRLIRHYIPISKKEFQEIKKGLNILPCCGRRKISHMDEEIIIKFIDGNIEKNIGSLNKVVQLSKKIGVKISQIDSYLSSKRK